MASKRRQRPRVAILGVGNVSRSDDAAGVLVVRQLTQWMGTKDPQNLLIVDGGPTPENKTGELRHFAPELVLIVDAADFGEAPGTIRWIPEEQIDGMSASTHSLPLSMLAHYLKLSLNCTVMLLGIQAASNQVGEHINPDVMQAVHEVVEALDIVCRRSGESTCFAEQSTGRSLSRWD